MGDVGQEFRLGAVGFLGAVDRELRIVADPARMASRGITYGELVARLREENGNFSGGKLPEGKNDVRVRAVGRFKEPRQIENLVLRETEGGPVLLRDVATVEIGFKEPTDWVRSRGFPMPYFNFQLETGANLLETMSGIDVELEELNAPGGLLEMEARRLGANGTFELVKAYDATTYVRQALSLVRWNIVVGGALATLVLLLFLRSFRTVGIIALAIPISIVVAIVVLVTLGRTVNIVSLAGMAFAVGMVVDNAIVGIENIFRHLEMGKRVKQAAVDGTEEVAGAVLASTLTTVVVFVPILLIEDSAGQLFRDIALAIVAAVGISLVVSIAVIPSAAATLLRDERVGAARASAAGAKGSRPGLFARLLDLPAHVARLYRWLAKTRLRQLGAKGSAVVREAVVERLVTAAPRDDVKRAVREDMRSKLSNRRTFAMLAQGRHFQGEDPRGLLLHAVWDPSEAARAEASRAIAEIGSAEVGAPLVRALSSETPELRLRAAEALGHTRDDVFVPALVDRLYTLASLPQGGGGGFRPPHANIFVGTQTAYVQDFDVEVAQFAAIADPVINTLLEGAVLDVGVIGVSRVTVRQERRVIIRSLRDITGADIGSGSKDWAKWWESDAASRYRVPPPAERDDATSGG